MSRAIRKNRDRPGPNPTGVTSGPRAPGRPAVAEPRRRRWWLAMLLAGLLGGGAAAALWWWPKAADPDEDMVWVPGGTFRMGSSEARFPEGTCTGPGCCGQVDSEPIHEVELDGFWIDRTPVTNAQFARFVEATGYVTVAEQVV